MTEKLGALAALVDLAGPARERALDAFARSYAAEPLILDKWFALAGADRRERIRSTACAR